MDALTGPRPHRRSGDRDWLWLTIGTILLTLVLWGRVLIGQRVLVAGDILYGVPPWSGSAGAHTPANPLVSDPVVSTLPWQMVVHHAFSHGHWPLWNSLALMGSPLLGNDQTGAFSPFTLLTLPFGPAHAVSLAMLAKLWLAGLATAFFLRQLGAGGKAAFFGGLAFGSSSYITVWLGYPNGTVAALMPLGFASVEWFLRSGRPVALLLLALDIGLMFLVGHAPSEAHLIGALAVYAAVRWSAPRLNRWWSMAGLIGAALIGLLVGGVQILPFVDALGNGVTFGLRLGQRAGSGHLSLTSVATWLIPNSHGNPAIDGLFGRPPNFSEATGFVGVGALVLAPLGVVWLWRRQRSAAVGLVTLVVVAAGVIYGPLSPIAGSVPILQVSNNARLLAVVCFVVSVLGGLGLEVVLTSPNVKLVALGRGGLGAGALALLGLGACWIALLKLRGGVDSLLPAVHGNIGFWIAVAALSLVAAVSFMSAGRWGGAPRSASSCLALLAVVEAMLFAWPFNPVTRLEEVPPPSRAIDWLHSHAGEGEVAAVFPAMIPESATLYGVRDVGGYDLVVTPRVVAYWTAADRGFQFKNNQTNLSNPAVPWLAAAGVTEVIAPGDNALQGAIQTYQGEGVTISSIPAARPFAYAASRTVAVSGPAGAAQAMSPDPLGVVAVEGGCCVGSQGAAKVRVLERDDGVVRLTVEAVSATTVVVGQAYYPGWQAKVDGRSTMIRPANILFQSVDVPAGKHDVTLEYRPGSFTIGALLSAAGLAGLLVLYALERRLVRRSS